MRLQSKYGVLVAAVGQEALRSQEVLELAGDSLKQQSVSHLGKTLLYALAAVAVAETMFREPTLLAPGVAVGDTRVFSKIRQL